MNISVNDQPLVSVLVVTYNQEEYISQTIESLLDQDCQFKYEILIGEDCSTDKTREICQSYEKKYPEIVKLFLNDENKGFIKNYFSLFRHVRGKYIADCGGDDYWISTEKLRKQVEILESHPDISLVYGNWQVLNEKEKKQRNNLAEITKDWFDKDFYGKTAVRNYLNYKVMPRVVLSTSCFRSDWLKKSMVNNNEIFFGDGVVCEDLPISMALLMNGPFYLMKEELMVYRLLENSVSHSQNREKYLKEFAWKVFLQTVNLAKTLGLNSNEIKPYLKSVFPEFVLNAFISGDKQWLDDFCKVSIEFNIVPGIKQKLLMFIMRSNFLEVIGRYVYLNFIRGNKTKVCK